MNPILNIRISFANFILQGQQTHQLHQTQTLTRDSAILKPGKYATRQHKKKILPSTSSGGHIYSATVVQLLYLIPYCTRREVIYWSLGPMVRSARLVPRGMNLWRDRPNPRSESQIWISFRSDPSRNFGFAKLPHFRLSALFVQWILQGVIFHTFTTWKRCETASVSSVIFAGAHNYLQSFRINIQYPRNICDVWKKSVYSHHTSPTLNNISTHVRTHA